MTDFDWQVFVSQWKLSAFALLVIMPVAIVILLMKWWRERT